MDRLVSQFPIIYVVDLDGIERGDPQLDYLQELSREATVWADAGVRTADQAIDVLVAGAARAVLSSATLGGPRELRRAWKLSSELIFEIETTVQGTRLRGDWPTSDPVGIADLVRQAGLSEVVLSPREIDVDWALVRTIAATGPVWVNGSFSTGDAPRLAENGASGGIFHLNGLLRHQEQPLPSGRGAPRPPGAR